MAPEVTAFGCEEIAQSAGQRLHSTIPRPGATAARVKRLAASGDPEVFATHRVAPSFAVPVVIDFILGLLFLWAFFKTPQEQRP